MNANELTEGMKLLVEANKWIQDKVAKEGGFICCRKDNLCLSCRLSLFVCDKLEPLPKTTQQPMLHVDGTPDDTYPLRILEAYLYDARTEWVVEGLSDEATTIYDIMNEHQRQRVIILEKAIAALGFPNNKE